MPIISQVVGILLTPIVTRLYAPEAFGLANVLGSVVMLFSVFATMGYHGAIILPQNDDNALNMLFVCFISMLGISTTSFFIVTVGKDFISAKLNAPELVNFLWLTPIFVFFHGIYQTLRYWNARLRLFDNIAISRITEILLKKCYQIPAGFLGYVTGGSLIFAGLFSAIAKNLILFKNIGLKNFGIIKKKDMPVKLLAGAKRYRKFPMFSVWSELLSRIPAIITSFLIIKYFGQDMLGYYGLSLMVLALPSTLITGSIHEAFSPRAAMAKHRGKHVDLLEKVYGRIVVLMVFPFMILGLFGDRLFSFVFGPEWVQAGIIAQILVFRIFFEIIFSPSLSLVDIMEKQELHVIRSGASSLIALVVLLLGAYYNNFYLALWYLVLLEGVSIIVFGGYMMRLIDFPFFLTMRKLSKYLLICIMLGAALGCIKTFFDFNNIFLVAIIGTTTVIYYTMILYFDREMLKILAGFFPSFSRNK